MFRSNTGSTINGIFNRDDKTIQEEADRLKKLEEKRK